MSVTVVPTGPELGVSVSVGVVRVNVALAVLPDESLAETEFEPVENPLVLLTAKLQENPPPEATVAVQRVVELSFTVAVSLGAKPVPLAVTVVPSGPLEGVKVSVGSGATESTVSATSEEL